MSWGNPFKSAWNAATDVAKQAAGKVAAGASAAAKWVTETASKVASNVGQKVEQVFKSHPSPGSNSVVQQKAVPAATQAKAIPLTSNNAKQTLSTLNTIFDNTSLKKPVAACVMATATANSDVKNLQPAQNPQSVAPASVLFDPRFSFSAPQSSQPNPPGTREINQKGIDLIKGFEGLSLKTYVDAAGHPTIGYGHLIKPGDPFNSKSEITQKQAEDLLQSDLAAARKSVQTLVKVPLNDNQFAAVVSFTFNLGAGKLKDSDLLAFINKGDFQSAANEFPKWNKARDPKTQKLVELRGLTRRRTAERDLFINP